MSLHRGCSSHGRTVQEAMHRTGCTVTLTVPDVVETHAAVVISSHILRSRTLLMLYKRIILFLIAIHM